MTLLTAFQNLVKTSSSSCRGSQFFKDTNVVHFFYSHVFNVRESGRPDAVGALRDIAYTQRHNINADEFGTMCSFFLEHASRPIINQAIRSILRCCHIHLRNIRLDDSGDYIDFLNNTEAAIEILNRRERKDDIYRAALVVALANENLITSASLYLDDEPEEQLWILALHSAGSGFGFNFSLLHNAPPVIKDNENVMLTSLQYNRGGFPSASARLKDKRSFVMKAVAKWGRLLEYASERLRDDFEVVKIAVTSEGHAIRYASERLQNNRELALLAIRDPHTRVFGHLPVRFRDDEELALSAIQFGDDEVIELVSDRLRDIKEIVLAAVRLNGIDLRHASARLCDDYEVVMTAISGRAWALQFASLRLKDDYRIVRKAHSLAPATLQYASDRLQALLRTDSNEI